jgi:16S rRNA C967 or C1407 C5-methylase (RsmB/RsmF family)
MAAAGLPEAFVARMRELLGPEAAAFLDSYRRPAQRAVRANPLKLDPANLPALLGTGPDPVPWCPEGFYLPQGTRVGDTLAHAAGLCYVQEPSAMAVAEALDVRPGQRVLDLAAAPGGKATQVAGRLGGQGVVVANEVQRGRVQALADNLDRWGSPRTVLAGETVARLADALPAGFDRVLLDAPCSGEGLFRRNPAAAAQWRPGHVPGSAERQRGLLADAARLVRPGGVLVYSTCTFAPEENEQQVAGFLTTHPDWRLLEIPGHQGFAPGRPDWSPDGPPELARTVRLWPHRLRGEGHFVAKLGRPEARDNPTSRRQAPRRGSVAQRRLGCRALSTAPEPGARPRPTCSPDAPWLSHPSVSLSPVIVVCWCLPRRPRCIHSCSTSLPPRGSTNSEGRRPGSGGTCRCSVPPRSPGRPGARCRRSGSCSSGPGCGWQPPASARARPDGA